MIALIAFLAASGVPEVSVILFIAGAAFWIVSGLNSAFRTAWAWDHGWGIGLMIFAIGLRVIFGV